MNNNPIKQAQEFAAVVNTLSYGGHWQEIILLRICFAGLGLREATTLKVNQIVSIDDDNEIGSSTWMESLGEHGDSFFGNKLSTLALRHAKSISAKAAAVLPDAPAFPSPKGGPITPRTAERRLAKAVRKMFPSNKLPACRYQLAKKIGRLVRSINMPEKKEVAESTDSHFAHQLEERIRDHRWLFRQMFPQDKYAQEDAMQELIVHILELHQSGRLWTNRVSRGLIFLCSNQYYRQFCRSKERFQPGVLEDWSFIAENRNCSSRGLFPNQLKEVQDVEKLRNEVASLLSYLNGEERSVIETLYGLKDGTACTQHEAAKKLGISMYALKRMVKAALNSMRNVACK